MSTENLYPVPIYTQKHGYILVENGATNGARAGVNLYDENGDLIPPENLSEAVLRTGDTMTGKLVNTASIHVPSGTMVLGAPTPESLFWNYTYPGNTYLTMDKATADNDASLVFTQGGRAKWEFGATTEGVGVSPRIHMKVVRNPTADPADDQFLDVMLWDYDSGDVWVNNGYKLGIGTLPQERLHVAGFNVSAARVVSKFENFNTGAGSQSAAHVFQGVGTSWVTGNDFGLNAGHNYFIQDGNSGALAFFANANGVSIGGSTVEATEALRVDSTDGGFLPPRLTTAQRDALGSKNSGLLIFNTDASQLEYWSGSLGAWLGIYSQDAPLSPTVANAATTLSATHLNGVIEKSDTSAYTYTIAPSLGAHGDSITIVNSGTAGNITLARGAGVALYQNGVDADITIGPGSMLKIYRSATADRWIA